MPSEPTSPIAAARTSEKAPAWIGRRYNEIETGVTFPARLSDITEANVKTFRAAIGLAPTSPHDDVIPAFLLNEILTLKANMRLPPGVLHAQEEMTLHSPAKVGETLSTTVAVVDKYVKNGKRFVVFEQTTKADASGALVLSVRRTLFWPC